ncbi:MAG: HAD-IA family hydrolase [Clostridia bacterium]|nr:HAD-IA family hydrolase [Clostridia bacterium]
MSKFYVIFDMDGTLLDTQRVHIPAWDHAGEQQGLSHVGMHIPYVCGMNEIGWGGYLLEHFPELDLTKFKKDAAKYVSAHRKVTFMPGALNLLEYLKKLGIPMAVASGSDTAEICSHMKELNVLHYFDAVVGGEQVQNGKPAPDIFLKAAELLGAEPADCFVFEDSANGVRAGHAAGMKCLGIPDIAYFDAEVKAMLSAELKNMNEAIPFLKKETVERRCKELLREIRTKHIVSMVEYQKEPIFFISERYPGVWLEHVYDGIVWAELSGEWEIARNYAQLFLTYQKKDGQLPCYFRRDKGIGYSQLQECVSFGALCYEIYEKTQDRVFLEAAYAGCAQWDAWLCRNRMGERGLLEIYCGFDTGHDNSSRLDGMKYQRNICADAAVKPDDCPVAPLIGSDLNAVFYGDRRALALMAEALDLPDAEIWRQKAESIRTKLFEYCFDEEDLFFYDVDRNGIKRKSRSIAITAFFCERVLEQELADKIFQRYFRNEWEFNTPYPYPSIARSDPKFGKWHARNNWGYFSQSLTMLRTLRWMEHYGYAEELRRNMEMWLAVWTSKDCPIGQELDPLDGSTPSEGFAYSSGMLFYLMAAKKLGYCTDF